MPNLSQILTHGLILSTLATIAIIGSFLVEPRIWLHDFPKEIQALVPPKTPREKQLTYIVGIPFLVILLAVPFISTLLLKNQSAAPVSFWGLLLNAFGVAFTFNVFDWLILDWLLVCTITPKLFMIPGIEDPAVYKDYAFHFRGFLKGTVISLVGGLVIAGIVTLL